MHLILRVLPLFAATGSLAVAASLFFEPSFLRAALPRAFEARWARRSVGALALAGGALMLASVAQPFFAFFAAVLASAACLAVLAAFVARRSSAGPAFAGFVLAAALASGALQPLGLRVLLLPKAEALPFAPAAGARVVKTYPAGTRFESVRAGPDGTLYLSANEGEDWVNNDKSGVKAQVLARAPSGEERVFFRLPPATTAGVLAFGPDGALYLTSDGAARGVWRLSADGEGTLVAKLPEGSWPNGICAGPDGQLYVADARRGAIWRVDPRAGTATIARDDAALKARPFVALAPAANGLHFFGRDLFVTVSDAARVLRFHLGEDGQLGAPAVFASGIPGDDFAVDSRGTLYVTTHPYDTLVRVTPDGQRTTVADARQGVIGATDATFGVLPGDTRTLYLVTDGGAFSTGDPRAAGKLLALTLPEGP